jgi:hypothetical protein
MNLLRVLAALRFDWFSPLFFAPFAAFCDVIPMHTGLNRFEQKEAKEAKKSSPRAWG